MGLERSSDVNSGSTTLLRPGKWSTPLLSSVSLFSVSTCDGVGDVPPMRCRFEGEEFGNVKRTFELHQGNSVLGPGKRGADRNQMSCQ